MSTIAKGGKALYGAPLGILIQLLLPRRRAARTQADEGLFTDQWQSDLRLCMRAMDSTLTQLLRSVAEGQLLTARSEARCLSKQAHTLDALLVPRPDVNL